MPVHGKSNLLELATGLGNHPETIQRAVLFRGRGGEETGGVGEGVRGGWEYLSVIKKAIYI